MTPTVNALATGAWRSREGEPVTIVGMAPNGRAAAVLTGDAKKPAYIPTRWIDGIELEPVAEPAPAVCPCCGRVLP